MKKLLHIIATPRGLNSNTLKVSQAFLDTFKIKYPHCIIDELNLFVQKLPQITSSRIEGKLALLSGRNLTESMLAQWAEIIAQIERFLSADAYLISAPMWNFSIPFVLKHYLDVIIQPKYLFTYTDQGPQGLIKNKKMSIVTSRGGDYSPQSPSKAYDLQEPYLRTIFGFVGITDITFIHAQPMDALGEKVRAEKISLAQASAKELAEKF